MTARIKILRAGPLTTIQDAGRPGMLKYGVSASGPMDRGAWLRAGAGLDPAGTSGIEFTTTGIDFEILDGSLHCAVDGGDFSLNADGKTMPWPHEFLLKKNSVINIKPGKWGTYGYLRFSGECDVPKRLGSRATNTIVRLGGLEGRPLRTGDVLSFLPPEPSTAVARTPTPTPSISGSTIRIIWGLHADLFDQAIRAAFISRPFEISTHLDRMGIRLGDPNNVFQTSGLLSLVSDAVVPGDIQILGDGTPIVLMRDHQPTGGYPRIATIISADLDQFAQMRPGSPVQFNPVSIETAQNAMRHTS